LRAGFRPGSSQPGMFSTGVLALGTWGTKETEDSEFGEDAVRISDRAGNQGRGSFGEKSSGADKLPAFNRNFPVLVTRLKTLVPWAKSTNAATLDSERGNER